MGAATWPSETHTHAGETRVSTTSRNDRYTGQSTEIDNAGTRASQRNPKTAQKALSGRQEGCLSQWWGFNRKLKEPEAFYRTDEPRILNDLVVQLLALEVEQDGQDPLITIDESDDLQDSQADSVAPLVAQETTQEPGGVESEDGVLAA